MDAAATRPQLPALGGIDADKIKRDEELYQSRNAGISSTLPPSSTTVAHTESTYHYTHGPPPPYSHPPPSFAPITTTTTSTDVGTPIDSRRSSGAEKEVAPQQSTRQSLPSISEVMGVDNQTSYQQAIPIQAVAQPPMMPLQAPPHKSLLPSSPVPAMRSYASEPPQAYAQPMKYAEPRSSYNDVRPALHLSAPQSGPSYRPTPSTSYPHLVEAPSNYEPAAAPAQSAPASFAYGYTPYPPRYQTGAPSSGGPVYQPSMNNAPVWKAEGASRHQQERSYGESVKRHLDLYDLEAALNDITATSSFLGDFSHRYSTLLHQSPRSGPHLSMLPGIIEVEDMISKSRAQTEALIKIRETVLAQQAAQEQEATEQRQQKSFGGELAPPHSGDSDDGKSSFGGDAKKRRGRAAPPGRCHSCNRAETPEWRRGPDGARTLCNACGLHYAKLTRKQNNAGKTSTVNSSNLRPKEHLP